MQGQGQGQEGRCVKRQGQGSREEIRERMRLKCVGRVKQERAGQLARLRAGGAHRVTTMQPEDLAGMARSLVHEEFAGHGDAMMGCEEGAAGPRPPDHSPDDDGMDPEEYAEFMRQLEAEVFEELRKQELEIIAQELAEHDQRELEHLSSSYQEGHQVICPVCMRNRLHQHQNIVFCHCGARLSLQTEQHSLHQIESVVTAKVSEHSMTGCQSMPAFSVQNLGDQDMMMMTCVGCDFMEIIV